MKQCTKLKHYSEEDTWHNINRLIKLGKIDNQNYDVYFCQECTAYHFGHSYNLDSCGVSGLKRLHRKK